MGYAKRSEASLPPKSLVEQFRSSFTWALSRGRCESAPGPADTRTHGVHFMYTNPGTALKARNQPQIHQALREVAGHRISYAIYVLQITVAAHVVGPEHVQDFQTQP